MKELNRNASHPDDGALVRYLDRQSPEEERRWMLAHLSACAECAARMEALSEQSRVVTGFVGALHADAAPDELTRARALAAARSARRRPAWYASGAMRAAAVIALAAVVTLGVEPVRAWVADRWADLIGAEEAAPVVVTAPEALERGSLISFAPAGETFVLELAHPQEAGSVTLELRDVEQASAQVINGGSEEILALPSGLRVENSGASTASYAFTLPSHLRLIQVFAGGRPVAILRVDDVTVPWTRTVELDVEAARD